MSYSHRQLNLHYLPLIAKALRGLFPGIELLGGGSTDHGFYYDFILEGVDCDHVFLSSLEQRMQELLHEGVEISFVEMVRDVALNFLRHNHQKAKALIFEEGYSPGVMTFLKIDEFLEVVGEEFEILPSQQLKHFELYDVQQIEGDGIVRLQGVAFSSNKELKSFRKKRKSFLGFDHLTLADEMSLYQYNSSTAEGVWLPKGVVLVNLLLESWKEFCISNDIPEIKTCSFSAEEFFEKFSSLGMPRSSEILAVQKDYQPEDCKGMWRLNKYLADRTYLSVGHSEVEDLLNSSLQSIIKTVNILGSDCCWVLCSPTTGPFTQKQPVLELQKALESSQIPYTKEYVEGDEGIEPRAYCLIPDGMGQYWKGPFVGLKYRDGKQQAVISCSLFGSVERIVASILEQYKGELPFALAPEHVRLISTPSQDLFAKQVCQRLKDEGFRVWVDQTEKRLAEKIHTAEKERIPFIAVIGEAEAKKNILTLRGCKKNDKQRKVTINDLLDELHRENSDNEPVCCKAD